MPSIFIPFPLQLSELLPPSAAPDQEPAPTPPTEVPEVSPPVTPSALPGTTFITSSVDNPHVCFDLLPCFFSPVKENGTCLICYFNTITVICWQLDGTVVLSFIRTVLGPELAGRLVFLRDTDPISNTCADMLIAAYDNLDLYDKCPITFPERFKSEVRGQFKVKGASSTPSVISAKRFFTSSCNLLFQLQSVTSVVVTRSLCSVL